MPVICPCCLQPMAAAKAPVDALESVPFSRLEHRIVTAMLESYPRTVNMQNLINACYWDDPNGGPDNPATTVMVTIGRLRKKLPPHGWTIPRNKAGNGNIAHYRLVPVEAK